MLKMADRFQKIERNLEEIVGEIIVEFAQENIDKKKFVSQKWLPTEDRSQATGKMRSNFKIRRNRWIITITNDLPYARTQNDGIDELVTVTSKKGTKFSRRMRIPARPFLGDSLALKRRILKGIRERIK